MYTLDICALHNNFVLGQVLLSMPSLGVSSLDFDRVGNDAVFFSGDRRRYSAASGGAASSCSGIAIRSAVKRARSSANASKPADFCSVRSFM